MAFSTSFNVTNGTFNASNVVDAMTTMELLVTLFSLMGCFFVVITYWLFLPLQRSPSNLVLWMALFGMALHICIMGQDSSKPEMCRITGTLTQFFLIAQELYLFMMTVDLYFTTRNPFSSTLYRNLSYHIIVWTVSGLLSICFYFTNAAGHSRLGICWFNSNHEYIYIYFHIYFICPIIFMYGSGFMLFVVARNRIKEGYEACFKTRNNSLRQMKLYVGMSACYWILVAIPYYAFQNTSTPTSSNTKMDIVTMNKSSRGSGNFEFMSKTSTNFGYGDALDNYICILLGLKGFLIAVLWGTSMHVQNAFTLWRSGNWDPLMKFHGVNYVLRRDIIYFATMGIRESISKPSDLYYDNRNSLYSVRCIDLKGRSEHHKALFRDYEASSFQTIREMSNINNTSFLNSMSANLRERYSEGKSGAFLYFTGDQRFIIKTCTYQEQCYLLTLLPTYINHLKSNPNSYISRYVGCHDLVVYDQIIRFIVLTNILHNPMVDIHEFFDLKGSWVGRYDGHDKQNTTKICKYCGIEFVVGMSKEVCQKHPVYLHGHEQEFCGKDCNWASRQISLQEDMANKIAEQLYSDVKFLYEMQSIDYSLIVGLHSCSISKYHHEEEIKKNKKLLQFATSNRVLDEHGNEVENSGTTTNTNVNNSAHDQNQEDIHSYTFREENNRINMNITRMNNSGGQPVKSNYRCHHRDSIGTTHPIHGHKIAPALISSNLDDGNTSSAATQSLLSKWNSNTASALPSSPLSSPAMSVVSGDMSEDETNFNYMESPQCSSTSKALIKNNSQFFLSSESNPIMNSLAFTPTSSTSTESELGECVVYLGIIDILTPWSLRKRLEHIVRVYFQWQDPHGISCVDPHTYMERFKANVIDAVIRGDMARSEIAFPCGRNEANNNRSDRLPAHVASDFTNTHMETHTNYKHKES